MIRIELDSDGIAGLRARWQARVSSGFKSAMDGLLARARQSAPRRTGRLAASISLGRSGPLGAELVYSAPYASYLYEGTGLYGPSGRRIVILPRRKRALWWPGAAHPVRRVVQRGIRPRDFVSAATASLAEDFIKGFGGDWAS